jgi:F-type H+-transporting ATPase subunit gamma
MPRFEEVNRVADFFIEQFVADKIDSVHVAYMHFHSAGQQRAEVRTLLPLGVLADSDKPAAGQPKAEPGLITRVQYEFSPSPRELLDELLPLTSKVQLFQAFLDAVTSENVARMVAMKSATDNADKMVKSLTMQYNRARQSQITTELSEIMGGVEAMKG